MGDNFVGYNEYLKMSPVFWFKYWIKDPQYNKIINLVSLTLLIFTLTIINSKKEKKKSDKKNLVLLIFSFLSILLWFFISPQLRYGGYFCFIFFLSLLFTFIFYRNYKKINYFNIILILFLSLFYVEVKNLNRLNNGNFDNFPYPNYTKLQLNKDYVVADNKNITFNKRVYSNKLIFKNSNEYILMCGDIDFPCISEGKEVCLGSKVIRNNYHFILKKEDNKSCLEFMNKNILY